MTISENIMYNLQLVICSFCTGSEKPQSFFMYLFVLNCFCVFVSS